jgi:TonB-like protein
VDQSVRALIQRDVEIAVQVEIDEAGKVVKATAVSHDPSLAGYLEKAAVSAAMRCRFEPARMGNKAVPSTHILRFTFRKP